MMPIFHFICMSLYINKYNDVSFLTGVLIVFAVLLWALVVHRGITKVIQEIMDDTSLDADYSLGYSFILSSVGAGLTVFGGWLTLLL